jgi:hypothetical protein
VQEDVTFEHAARLGELEKRQQELAVSLDLDGRKSDATAREGDKESTNPGD